MRRSERELAGIENENAASPPGKTAFLFFTLSQSTPAKPRERIGGNAPHRNHDTISDLRKWRYSLFHVGVFSYKNSLIHEPVLDRVAGQIDIRRQAHFFGNAAAVGGDGFLAEGQIRADLLDRFPGGDELEDLQLAIG